MSETKASPKALFSFDPADLEPEDERQRFKAKNREAFERADYTPPEAATPQSAPVRKAAKTPAKAEPPKVPSFRRKRGRPAGDRRYRVSFKSTEQHLAALYGIAGEGELVGVFERAIELLAREVARSGRYGSRKLDLDARKAVDALLREVDTEQ